MEKVEIKKLMAFCGK